MTSPSVAESWEARRRCALMFSFPSTCSSSVGHHTGSLQLPKTLPNEPEVTIAALLSSETTEMRPPNDLALHFGLNISRRKWPCFRFKFLEVLASRRGNACDGAGCDEASGADSCGARCRCVVMIYFLFTSSSII